MARMTIINPVVFTVGATELAPMVTNVVLTSNQMSQTANFPGEDGPCVVPSNRSSGDTVGVTILTDFDNEATGALWNMLGTNQTVVVRQSTATASSSNPQFTALCFISSNTPLSGDVGSNSPNQMTWDVTGRIARTVS